MRNRIRRVREPLISLVLICMLSVFVTPTAFAISKANSSADRCATQPQCTDLLTGTETGKDPGGRPLSLPKKTPEGDPDDPDVNIVVEQAKLVHVGTVLNFLMQGIEGQNFK